MAKDSTVILRAAVSLGALVLVVLHHYAPRNASDGMTIGLVVLAFLPWLSPIIKSIEISGLGKIELKVDEVKEQVESLKSGRGRKQYVVLIDRGRKYLELREKMG